MKDVDIAKVASLARLKITPEEQKTFAPQLESIFDHFEKIASIDTEGVEPLVTPTDMEVVYRDDVVHPFEAAKEILEQAPEKMGNLYKVPPVV